MSAPTTAPARASGVPASPGELALAARAGMAHSGPQRPRTLALLRWLQVVCLVAALAMAGIGAVVCWNARQDAIAAAGHATQYQRLTQIRAHLLTADAISGQIFVLPTDDAAQYPVYLGELAGASKLIVEAGGAQAGDRDQLAAINTAVSRFAAAMSAARAANTPLGKESAAADLVKASAALRTDAIAPLDQLVQANQAGITGGSLDAGRWIFAALGIGTLALVLVSAYLVAVRFRRVVNLGLALALVLLGAAWAIGATTLGGVATQTDVTAEQHVASASADARQAVLNARTQESLGLLDSGSAASYEKQWASSVATASAAIQSLAKSNPALTGQLNAYTAAHKSLRALADAGKPQQAASATQATRSAASTLDTALAKLTTTSAGKVATALTSASLPLELGALGVGVCAALAGAAATIGIDQRLREYR